jgi:hypothetical protein
MPTSIQHFGESSADLTSIAIVASFIIVKVLLTACMYKTLKSVPANKREVPSWLTWFMLCPGMDLIFSWILLPFAIPKSLQATSANNPESVRICKKISKFGFMTTILYTLYIVIFMTSIIFGGIRNESFAFSTLLGINIVCTPVIAYITWILYCMRIMKFRRMFLKPSVVS